MPPRVLYLSPGLFDKGGISRYGRYQLKALRELVGDNNVEALSLLSPDGFGFEEPFAVTFSSFGPTPRGKHVFAIAALTAALRFKPTIVWSGHVHFGLMASLLSASSSARLVENVYGGEVWSDLTWARRFALRRADLIVSDCHFTLDYIVNNGIARNDKACVHWDCVDLVKFCPGPSSDVLKKYGVHEDKRVKILTLGRITDVSIKYKGFARLLAALPSILDRMPVRVIIAGGGAGLPRLRQMVLDSDLSGSVDVVGAIHEDDLPDLYRACDIFTLVTHRGYGMGEGIPLTPLEAAACGKPVIVGNDDGSQEAVQNGTTGIIVGPHDTKALVNGLCELARDEQLRVRMGDEGRKRIEREHGYERFRARTADALRRLTV